MACGGCRAHSTIRGIMPFNQALSRRSALKIGAGAGAAALLTSCGSDSSDAASKSEIVKPKVDGDITWFTYEGYVSPKVVKAFEKEYGVAVNLVYYTNLEGMVQKVAAGIDYDLITTNSAVNSLLISEGLLNGYNPADVTDFDQIIPYFADAPYDDGQVRYTVPYGYGPAGIAYQSDKVDVTGSWNDLWDNTEAKGKIYVLEQQDETLGMSLMRDGASVNSGETDEVTTAADELIALKPSLGGISSDVLTLIGGDVAWMCHAWAGSVYQAWADMDDSSHWDFEWPSEGLSMGCDTLSVGGKAKSPGTALAFMQFTLDPEQSHTNTLYTGYSNGTIEGEAASAEITKNYPSLTLPQSDLTAAQWREAPTGARKTLWDEQWTRFRA